MLGISVITGYLFTQRLKTSVDITNSTKAIFAADAGLEMQLYDIFRGISGTPGYSATSTYTLRNTDIPPSVNVPEGAGYEVERVYNGVNGFIINSLGNHQSIYRQLELEVILFGS